MRASRDPCAIADPPPTRHRPEPRWRRQSASRCATALCSRWENAKGAPATVLSPPTAVGWRPVLAGAEARMAEESIDNPTLHDAPDPSRWGVVCPPGTQVESLRHLAAARPRRDGGRLRGVRPGARPEGRAQVPAAGRHRGDGVERPASPAPPRGQGHGPPVAPERRDAVPGRSRARRAHLPRDGAGRRGNPRRLAQGQEARVARDSSISSARPARGWRPRTART